jgi:hypothetical protein
MKHIFFFIFAAVFLLACLALGYGVYRTWITGRMSEYDMFRLGALPSAMPEGLWNGSAVGLGEVSWKGKKFFDGGRGINVFVTDDVQSDQYPFAFFETEGEDQQKVIRLDYNEKDNPLWLRFIVDEMVSVSENEFLGLVYIKLLPGFPFRMGYFRLGK